MEYEDEINRVLEKIIIKNDDPEYLFGKANQCFIEEDYQSARMFLRMAAEHEHVKAMYNLGYMLHMGLGGSKDYREAVSWYQKAADKGDTAAQNNLGVCYKEGKGVKKSSYTAKCLFEASAKQGYAAAQNNLGSILLDVYDKPSEAKKWFELAAKNGDDEAKNNLRRMKIKEKGDILGDLFDIGSDIWDFFKR